MALGAAYLVSGIAAVFVAGMLVSGGLPAAGAPKASAEPASGPDAAAAPPEGMAFAASRADPLVPAGFHLLAPPDMTHEPPFPIEQGKRPSLDEAKSLGRKYSRFIAKGDGGIEKLRNEGHLKGNGTPESPYVLEDFYVDGELSFTSLHKALIVRNGYVAGQFKLNYVGDQVYVHHVYAKDLRINENIKRDGHNTGGLFHDNHFSFVGQIRHYTGEFRHNQVGPKPGDAINEALGDSGLTRIANEVVFNFDGFHGADVHHNDYTGQVDIKLHGHNHGDCFTCPIHDHHDATQYPGQDNENVPPSEALGFRSRHSVRYASLLFRDNQITVPGGIALRYNDLNHAGDDRTANSEPNKFLEDPHVHFQDITIRGNRLQGGSLQVDVFNAPDPKHAAQNRGILRLWDNDVRADHAPPTATRAAPTLVFALQIRRADGLELSLRDNDLEFRELPSSNPADAMLRAAAAKVERRGIQLETIDASNLTIERNSVFDAKLGLFASALTDSTQWTLRANAFRTDEAWRGKDVANAPKEE